MFNVVRTVRAHFGPNLGIARKTCGIRLTQTAAGPNQPHESGKMDNQKQEPKSKTGGHQLQQRCIARIPTRPSWSCPPVGMIKINTDAAVWPDSDHVGVGAIGRDENGVVKFAFARYLLGHFSSHLAEVHAVLEGCLVASQHVLVPWIIESDALSVVNAILDPVPKAPEEHLIYQINQLLRSQNSAGSIQHCGRSANVAAHCLAHFAFHSKSNADFVDRLPLIISAHVQNSVSC